jgi:hypothetical protein
LSLVKNKVCNSTTIGAPSKFHPLDTGQNSVKWISRVLVVVWGEGLWHKGYILVLLTFLESHYACHTTDFDSILGCEATLQELFGKGVF